MWNRFWAKPFELGVGIYVITNGIMTFFPQSAVRDVLWNMLGDFGLLLPVFQILAGSLKIVGMAINKSNLEVAGLVMVTAMFAIRAITLVADGSFPLAEVNSFIIALLIVFANVVRIISILQGYVMIYFRNGNNDIRY